MNTAARSCSASARAAACSPPCLSARLPTAAAPTPTHGLRATAGPIISVDRGYADEIDNDKLRQYGILGVEMEAAALYTLAAGAHVQALALFTVSDHLLTGEACTADERQTSFNDMIKIALETAIED